MVPRSAPPLYTVLPFILMLLAIAVLPAVGPALVGAEPEQVPGRLPAGPADPRTLRGPRARGACADGRGVCLLHRPARRPLRDRGGGAPPRRSGRHPADQHGLPGGGIAAGLLRRNHRSVDAADPAAAPDQPRANTREAHGGLLHLHGVERGRHAHPAWRSPAVPGVSAGSPLHVDVPTLAALAPDGGGAASRLLHLGFDPIRAGAHLGSSPGPSAARTPPDPRGDQRGLAGRGGPGGRPPAGARPGNRDPGAGRHLPLADAARDPPRQRLHGLPDLRGGRALLRDLPDDDPGPGAAARSRGPSWA